MSTAPSAQLAVGDRLPALTLDATGRSPVDLRRTRHDSSVLVFPHADCEACVAYLRSLDEVSDLAAWGGRVLIVAADDAQARDLAERFDARVMLDAGGQARSGTGVPAGQASVLVTDRFGVVYRSQAAGPHHDLPTPRDVLDEVRHVVTQCPECGVPDDPLRGEESWRR